MPLVRHKASRPWGGRWEYYWYDDPSDYTKEKISKTKKAFIAAFLKHEHGDGIRGVEVRFPKSSKATKEWLAKEVVSLKRRKKDLGKRIKAMEALSDA